MKIIEAQTDGQSSVWQVFEKPIFCASTNHNSLSDCLRRFYVSEQPENICILYKNKKQFFRKYFISTLELVHRGTLAIPSYYEMNARFSCEKK